MGGNDKIEEEDNGYGYDDELIDDSESQNRQY